MSYKFSSEQGVYEFRGVRDLVFAEVISDTDEEYTTGQVYDLSRVAEISRTTETSSEAHYYDNKPLIVVTSTGSDELTLTITPMDLQTYAMVTGQTFDATTGSLIEGERDNKYFAIGYITKGTDGKERYVWRYKGMFNIPDETNSTENDGTDTTNTELTWTGVSTVHKFNKNGKSAKALVCDERYAAVDFTTFFDIVNTPDTLVGTGISGTATPQIFPTISSFNTQVRVSIICDTPNASIVYTDDGTTPNATTGTEYTAPFNITTSKTIRAIAHANGLSPSLIATKTFTKIS